MWRLHSGGLVGKRGTQLAQRAVVEVADGLLAGADRGGGLGDGQVEEVPQDMTVRSRSDRDASAARRA